MEKRSLIEEFHLSLFAPKGKLAEVELDRAVRHVRSAAFRRKLTRLLRELIRDTPALKRLRAEVSW
jgi:hypothetical protein